MVEPIRRLLEVILMFLLGVAAGVLYEIIKEVERK